MTDHLVQYLQEVVAPSDNGCVTFLALSDEETAALESDDRSGLTVRPWIESQDRLDAESAAVFGRRSLYMRGLATIDQEPGGYALNLTQQLQFAADARHLGVGYIFAQAAQNGQRTGRNNVLQSRVGTFEEDIDDFGIHRLSGCTYRTALQRLAAWAIPPSSNGQPIRESVPARRWQRWASKELGPNVRTVEINLALPDGSGSFAESVWHTAFGNGSSILGVPAGGSINVSSATPSQLEYALAEQVTAALGVAV
ncbi:hypothetical protein MU582_10720 [Nocardioidaceae bacterium SCSIO 66511]|nr:hypothetical protein MU582_10720 [Nocardioidaceae bacterium SCSIO 66511]